MAATGVSGAVVGVTYTNLLVDETMDIVQQLSPGAANIAPDFMRRRAPELARDIVCQLDTPENLARHYGLTDTQWIVLKNWPSFIQLMRETTEELAGSAGTPERARRKAALAISEVGVHDMAVIMGDSKSSPRDRIAAFDQLKDIAGLGAKQVAASIASTGASVFGGALIQIVMPNGAQLNVAEAEPEPKLLPAIDGEATRVEGDK